jgi:hypothetical protein
MKKPRQNRSARFAAADELFDACPEHIRKLWTGAKDQTRAKERREWKNRQKDRQNDDDAQRY